MLLVSKITSIEEGAGRSMSDKKIALSVWGGRWDEFYKQQKKPYVDLIKREKGSVSDDTEQKARKGQ